MTRGHFVAACFPQPSRQSSDCSGRLEYWQSCCSYVAAVASSVGAAQYDSSPSPCGTAAEATVIELQKEYTEVDAEELAEESSDDGSRSDSPTSPQAAGRRRLQTQSFGGFHAAAVTAVNDAEELSPEGFGGDAVSRHTFWVTSVRCCQWLQDVELQATVQTYRARVWNWASVSATSAIPSWDCACVRCATAG